jgi:hypothetical protein
MSTIAATTAVTNTSATTDTDSLAEAKLAVARASAEIAGIDAELNRLALAKAQATAAFNFACQHLAHLKEKEATS